MKEFSNPLLDRFEGALLGTAVGDILGMPVEGWSREEIQSEYGVLQELLEARLGKGTYTDDTEMTIALAESLIQKGGLDEEDLVQSFLRHYDSRRGYGAGTREVLQRLRAGVPWHEAARDVFPGGSYGNGCAMRVAPIGLFYAFDLSLLKEAAMRQSELTHAHPLAREGAFLQALSVALLLREDPKQGFDPLAFVAQLNELVAQETFSFVKSLELIETFLRKPPNPNEVIQRLGHDSRVIRSQPTALYCFLAHSRSFEEAVVYAVNLGGDTDTLGAMTGALAGAFLGAQSIPSRWLGVLEGRKTLRSLALDLYRAHLRHKR